jgi:hypothetical protein
MYVEAMVKAMEAAKPKIEHLNLGPLRSTRINLQDPEELLP